MRPSTHSHTSGEHLLLLLLLGCCCCSTAATVALLLLLLLGCTCTLLVRTCCSAWLHMHTHYDRAAGTIGAKCIQASANMQCAVSVAVVVCSVSFAGAAGITTDQLNPT
jgi:hypothetical protein